MKLYENGELLLMNAETLMVLADAKTGEKFDHLSTTDTSKIPMQIIKFNQVVPIRRVSKCYIKS